jgi:hypothetical protein
LADQTHFVSLRDANSQEVKRYKLEQKPEVLLQWVNELQQRFPRQRVAVALEQTRGALIYALMSYEFFVLFPVIPKRWPGIERLLVLAVPKMIRQTVIYYWSW